MMYGIYHGYDVEGEYGDAVSRDEIVAFCDDKEMAKAYVERWSNLHAYAKSHSYLYCGYLYVKPLGDIPVITTENEMESPWKWTFCPEGYVNDDEEEEDDDE